MHHQSRLTFISQPSYSWRAHSLVWVQSGLCTCWMACAESLCERFSHREASAMRCGRNRCLIPLGDRNTLSREQVGAVLTCPKLGGQACIVSGKLWVCNGFPSCSSHPLAPSVKQENVFLRRFSLWEFLSTADRSSDALRIQVWGFNWW